MFNTVIKIVDRLLGTHIGLRSKRKYMAIDSSVRLQRFAVDFLATPEDRVYLTIGKQGLIGAHVIFESAQGRVEIGERAYIGDATIICRENVRIGSDVMMAWGITIYDHNSNSLDWRRRAKTAKHFYDMAGTTACYDGIDWTDVKSAPIAIEDKAWIGFDAVILKGVTIGEGAVVGARSVVSRNVEPYSIVAGNPARPVGRVEAR